MFIYHFWTDFCIAFFVIFIAKAASVLQSRLLDDKNQWTSAVMTWSRLQGELTGSKNTIKTSSPALGVTRKREDEMRGSDEQSREGEKSLVEFRSTGGERKEEIDKQRSGGQNGVSTMAQKRKRDEEEEEKERKVAAWDTGIEKTVEKGKACEEERTREEEAEGMLEEFIDCTHGAYVNGGGPVCDHTASRLEHRGASSSRKMDDIAKDFTEESQENGNAMATFYFYTSVTSEVKVFIYLCLLVFISI